MECIYATMLLHDDDHDQGFIKSVTPGVLQTSSPISMPTCIWCAPPRQPLMHHLIGRSWWRSTIAKLTRLPWRFAAPARSSSNPTLYYSIDCSSLPTLNPIHHRQVNYRRCYWWYIQEKTSPFICQPVTLFHPSVHSSRA